ncbi:MAG: helix-turn-helix domain-containing protein [Pseudonocardiaceae bacterium]
MGTAAELLGVQPAFLRSLDAAGLLSPGRSAGGQRRYSRADLTRAARVRALLDENMPLTAATRIVSLEHQLATAHQRITHLEQTTGQRSGNPSDRGADHSLATPQRRRRVRDIDQLLSSPDVSSTAVEH